MGNITCNCTNHPCSQVVCLPQLLCHQIYQVFMTMMMEPSELLEEKIIWVVQTIFYGAAVILVIWSGVKFVIAAPEAKAELKKKFIYMVVGAVFLFAAGGITTIIGNMAMNNI